MMHRKIVFFFTAALYYGTAAYALSSLQAGLLVTTLVLYAVPAWVLARVTRAPSAVIIAVALLGAGLSVLFEAIAALYGLWYTVGSDATRLFGLVPLEAVVALTIQTLFYALLYESLFDDAAYTVRHARQRIALLLLFVVASITIVGFHAFVFGGVLFNYSYLWIVGGIVAASFTMLALHKVLSVHFFDRVINFALVAALPTLLGVWIGAHNTHRVYGYPDAYIGTVNLFGMSLPVDEVLLAIALPLLIAVIYELYLDDRY